MARPGNGKAPRKRTGASARKKTAAAPRGKRAAAAPAPEVDLLPSNYIAKIDRETGDEVPEEIEPGELLVHAHRDHHPLEIAAQFVASRLIEVTGNEALVNRGLRTLDRLGGRVASTAAELSGNPSDERRVKRMLGVSARDVAFRFRETTHLSEKEVRSRVRGLQKEAQAALAAQGRHPRLRVLLTGATGFVGKEILVQAARHPHVEEVVSVVRPQAIRDRKTKKVLKTLSPRHRGAQLLKQLHIGGKDAKRFRFIKGDIEKPASESRPPSCASWRRPSPTSSTARPACPSTTPTRTRSAPTCSGAATRSASRRASRGRRGRVRRPRRHRDVLHPRAPQALDRPGGESSFRGTSTTTTTSSPRPWPRSKPIGSWWTRACG